MQLPKVNRLLAEKLLNKSDRPGKKKKELVDGENPLGDQRFVAMFSNAEFEVDEESEEFQRLHPVLSHREKKHRENKKHSTTSGLEEEEEKV